MQLFGSLKVLMALLGSSCPLLGRSGPKMGPKMGPKSGPKSDQKVVQKMTPKMTKKSANFGPQNGPQNGPRRRSLLTGQKYRSSQKALFPKMAPRWPQDGPRWPQDGPEMAQDGPRCLQDGRYNLAEELTACVNAGSCASRTVCHHARIV